MPPVQTPNPYGGGYQQNQMPPHHAGLKLLPITVALLLLFVLSVAFGFWAFASMQDYKNNSDKKSAAAVKVALADQQKKLEAEFAEREKSPVKTYQGPSSYGSVKIMYPKTWGAYVDESGEGDAQLDAYFNPNFVPGLDTETANALRVQVMEEKYNDVLEEYKDQVSTGELKASPYAADQVKSVVGIRLNGKVSENFRGSIILLPLRDKTLKIWTEKEQNIADLNNIVLKNLTFSP
jgi:hypothetical protein